MRRSRLLVLLAVSTVAVAAGIGGLVASRPPATDVGRVPAGTAAARITTTTAPADPAVTGPRFQVRSGRLEDLATTAGAPPVRIAIEPLGIDVPVTPTGVEPETAAVAVPEDVDVAGWYRFGPRPGEPGSAVVTAHVDSAEQGPGAFFRLREAEPDTVVTVFFGDGTEERFEVMGRRRYGKEQLPTEQIFARGGEPVLTLVTCGGAFDASTRHYEENVVVYARPVADPPRPR